MTVADGPSESRPTPGDAARPDVTRLWRNPAFIVTCFVGGALAFSSDAWWPLASAWIYDLEFALTDWFEPVAADSNRAFPVLGSTRYGTIIFPERSTKAARPGLLRATLWST